jgi:hypothetical protein
MKMKLFLITLVGSLHCTGKTIKNSFGDVLINSLLPPVVYSAS